MTSAYRRSHAEQSIRTSYLRHATLYAAAALLAALPATAAAAQTAAPAAATGAPMAYDVVSIKPNTSGSGSIHVHGYDTTYSASNITFKMLVESAYDTKTDLIIGTPKPLESAHFDIEAKLVSPDPEAVKKITSEDRKSMQRSILDRFAFKYHTETKVLPVFELVAVKSGAKLKESAPEPPKDTTDKPAASPRLRGMHVNNTEMTAGDMPISGLADFLSNRLHRTVIDRTGLTGKYDFSLKWLPAYGPDNSQESSDASLFTALQEQLGLRLQSSKGPVTTLVIDHAEVPAEN